MPARAALLALLLLPTALAVTPPLPIGVAGKCALVDLRLGESTVVGAQCTEARIDSAGHDCIVLDAGLDCRLHWQARAIASTWVTDGSATVTLSGSCADTQQGSWLPGSALTSFSVRGACTTPDFWVQRGTCVLVPLDVRAAFRGTLPGPDQELRYESGVCDRRDPP